MGKIAVLPPEIVSKIAAGEVIERPASVIKELVENSLDAGASSIEVRLENAGKTSLIVKDDGSGIARDDIEHIFLRHSTSKLQSIDDLYSIASLGFRGEALYSIASIADVILKSRPAGQDTGWQLHVRSNRKLKLQPVAMQQGTEIQVRELFFNTPARKKFLKSDTTEMRQLYNIFLPYCILYPQKRFLLINNEKDIIDLKAHGSALLRLAASLNLPEKHLVEGQEEFDTGRMSIRLLLGDVNIPRVSRDSQFIFVNNRPVQHRLLSFHINQVYKTLFTQDVVPAFAVFIDLPPEDVDVNVHPAKREVKIRDEQNLVPFLRSFCEGLLRTEGAPKEIKTLFTVPEKTPGAPPQEPPGDTTPGPNKSEPIPQHYLFREQEHAFVIKEEPVLPQRHHPLKDLFSGSRFIGSFLNTYLLFESPGSLLVVDQHAAWERITYEKLKNQIEKRAVQTQDLLSPLLIHLTPQEMLLWEEIKELLEKAGFIITAWDKEHIALHSYPQILTHPEASLRAIISGEDARSYDLDSIAQWACKQSIKAKDPLSREQAEYLREQLLKCAVPLSCPHGRPTVIQIQEDTLVRQFLRT